MKMNWKKVKVPKCSVCKKKGFAYTNEKRHICTECAKKENKKPTLWTNLVPRNY